MFLEDLDVRLPERVVAEAAGAHREIRSIGSGARATFELVEELIRWPLSPNLAWRKGFLAGIFDAEGSCGGANALRISNKDGTIVHWTHQSLERLGFDTVVEPANRIGVKVVRIRGGLKERLRFFHMTDPAITRKRSIEGVALKAKHQTRVVSVEPLGMELPLYDITTGTGDFIADGVVSHNCFARPTHEYLDLDAGRDFEKEIVVKVNVPEVLRAELARPSWGRHHIAMGTNTDPYQWVEGRYKLMRGIWEAMRDFANPCSILTKSPLLLRDKDLLLEIAERTQVSACLSVPTLEEKAWRSTEPHTPHPRARLEAVAELNRIGIPTGILIAPLMPGINDQPEQVRQDRRAGHGGGRRPHRRPDAVPARLGQGDLLRLAARAPARSRGALRAAVRERGVPAGRRAARDRAAGRRPLGAQQTRPSGTGTAARAAAPARADLRGGEAAAAAVALLRAMHAISDRGRGSRSRAAPSGCRRRRSRSRSG